MPIDAIDAPAPGSVSAVSVLAGLITAYGAFVVVAAIVGSILSAADVDTEFRTNDWTGSGPVAALAMGVTLLLAYLFGGYVAGRMARRSGVRHGVAIFVASLVVGGLLGGVVASLTDEAQIRSNLRSIGVPTDWDQVSGVALTGAIVSIAAILGGAIVGGLLGERWHTKLAGRANDPEIGPEVETRRGVEVGGAGLARRMEREAAIARARDRAIDLRGHRVAGDEPVRAVDVDRIPGVAPATTSDPQGAGGSSASGPAGRSAVR